MRKYNIFGNYSVLSYFCATYYNIFFSGKAYAIFSLLFGFSHQTAGNDVSSRSSLRGTKQSRKHYNALCITGLLRKLAMTDRHDVIGSLRSNPEKNDKLNNAEIVVFSAQYNPALILQFHFHGILSIGICVALVPTVRSQMPADVHTLWSHEPHQLYWSVFVIGT